MYLGCKFFQIFLVIVILSSSIVFGQAPSTDKSDQAMSGFCVEFVGQVHFIQGRLVELQKAVPQEKYSWRPAEGVRSVGEVYLHAAAANYYFAKFTGYEVPKDIDVDMAPEKLKSIGLWDKKTTDKNEITKILERSFSDLLTTTKKIKESDLEKNIHVFGMDMTLRNFMVSSLNHMHEHLGQSIAYARSNGITPPWSQKEQAASK
jgi:uncharacterized damage-inducible protein DinB